MATDQLHPSLAVTYRDLSADPALHLSGEHMAAFQGAAVDDATVTADLIKRNAYMEELPATDLLVIGAPMHESPLDVSQAEPPGRMSPPQCLRV